MTDIWIGLLAGLSATILMSALMLMQASMRLMPDLDIVGMIGGMMKSTRVMGWLGHFMVGTVLYGGAFVLILTVIDTESYVVVGLALGAIGWSMVMVGMMPMAGKGLFGMKGGVMVPVMSLFIHLLFGGVLGLVYGALI